MSIFKKHNGNDSYSIFVNTTTSRRNLFDFSLDHFHEMYPNLKNGFKPKVKLNEYETHYLINFRVPGLKEDDIKIDVSSHEITLKTDSVVKGYTKTLSFKKPINVNTIRAYSLGDTYKIIAVKS